jgi:hypothetical protein
MEKPITQELPRFEYYPGKAGIQSHVPIDKNRGGFEMCEEYVPHNVRGNIERQQSPQGSWLRSVPQLEFAQINDPIAIEG